MATPLKSRGAPGVAILDADADADADGDGDLDLYVTNGPGTANSLYSNQWVETGSLTFVDIAIAAGVDATGQDSTGTCFGEIELGDAGIIDSYQAVRLFTSAIRGYLEER